MLYAPCESRSPAARSIVIHDLECIIYVRPLLMQYLARLMRCWLLDWWQRSAGDTILPGSRPDVPNLGGVSQPVSTLCPYFKIAPPTRVPASRVRRCLGRSCVCFPLRLAPRLSVEQKWRNKHGDYAIWGAFRPISNSGKSSCRGWLWSWLPVAGAIIVCACVSVWCIVCVRMLYKYAFVVI